MRGRMRFEPPTIFRLDSTGSGETYGSMDARTFPHAVCQFALMLAALAPANGAAPFDSATVTRVENKTIVAEIKGGQATGAHPAIVSEVILASSFLQTTKDARAELEFIDKSLLRVGPNTVFSFDARSRTLSLEKGDMLFYLPPGRGGVKLKTAALTAALTGTVVLLSPTGILALDGTVTLNYVEDGVQKKALIAAGTGHNAAKWVFGKLIVYQSGGKDEMWFRDRSKLLNWAALPDNAEKKIARNNPWLKEAAADYAGNDVWSFPNDAWLLSVVPLFGGSASSGSTTVTTVLPNGSVGIFDSIGRFLGLR